MFKTRTLTLISAMLLVFLTYACSQGQQSTENDMKDASIANAASAGGDVTDDTAAATVNGKPVPMSDLRIAVQNVIIQNGMDASHVDAFMNQFGPRILDQLIEGELLYQAALEGNYLADEEEIDQTFSELSSRYADPAEFTAEMEARGYTEETLRSSIGRQMSIQKYIKETIVPQAVVPEEAVREAYDQNPQNFVKPEEVQASHILIKSSESDSQEMKDEALEKAKEIASKAREKGADFAQLAREYSEGPSASSGGELGFFTRDRMVKPFEDAAFSMKVNEISDPVLTQFGYHIIKVTDRKEGSTVPFEEVKDALTQDLTNRMISELIGRKLAELKENAKIEILFTPAPQAETGEVPEEGPME
jgi:peptidyl-prolyl cis-trans isomerase C